MLPARFVDVPAPHLDAQERVLRGVIVDVDVVFLMLTQTRLPVAFHAISVVLLAALHHRVFLFAGSQTIVLAIITLAPGKDIGANVAGWSRLNVPGYDGLPAQQLAPHIPDRGLVHGERRFAPNSAAGHEVESLGHDAGAAVVARVLSVLPDAFLVAFAPAAAPFDLVAMGGPFGQRHRPAFLRFDRVPRTTSGLGGTAGAFGGAGVAARLAGRADGADGGAVNSGRVSGVAFVFYLLRLAVFGVFLFFTASHVFDAVFVLVLFLLFVRMVVYIRPHFSEIFRFSFSGSNFGIFFRKGSR